MATSRWADVVDALVDAMRAQSGYRTPGADAAAADVLVLDGPEDMLTEDPATRLLIIGGTLADEDPPGDIGQSVATQGTSRSRDETGSILCTAVAQVGGVELPDAAEPSQPDTVRTLRRAAFNVMAGVETLLRGNPTLGLATGPHMNVEIGTRISVQQYLTDEGAVCAVTFAVQYSARI